MRCCWTRSRHSSGKVSKLVCTSPYITAHLGGDGGGEERGVGGGKGGRGVGRRGREREESRGGEEMLLG